MNFFSISKLLVLLLFIPAVAFGEDGGRNQTAINLGWLAIGSGLVANLSIIIFKLARKIPLMRLIGVTESVQGLVPFYKPILNFHLMLNSVGFFAGLSHGFLLLRGLDAISLSLVITMTVSMISGVILKFTSDRHSKFFGRLVHGQFILAVLLVALVCLHVLSHDSFD